MYVGQENKNVNVLLLDIKLSPYWSSFPISNEENTLFVLAPQKNVHVGLIHTNYEPDEILKLFYLFVNRM